MATRDIPKSFKALTTGWIDNLEHEVTFNRKTPDQIAEEQDEAAVRKVQGKNLWPVFASGAGLFSDGYVNNSIGTVSTCLSLMYGKEYSESSAISNVSAIAFVGTVVGQLSFGYISDHIARKGGMMIATGMLIVLPALTAAGAWGANGSPQGLFAAITAFRFFLGVGIGAEYPTASVISSEAAQQLPSGHRNRYFAWFTNFMIDLGFVMSAFAAMVCLWIYGERHLNALWRTVVGIGSVPPLILLFFRMKMSDSPAFKKMNIKNAKKVPYGAILKFYWFRLTIVSLIWFIYDFSAYSFGTYSSYILTNLVTEPDGSTNLYKSFGWNVVFNLFYIPGAFLGALSADYFGPRLTCGVGLIVQAAVGFIMAGCYDSLAGQIGAFTVVFGIFSTLGEFSAGDNVGLLASKTSASTIRGEYYGIAAAIGKIGAFCGSYAFPYIIRHSDGIRTPVYISAALNVVSAILCIFFLPRVGQDAVAYEDAAFLDYLTTTGYDINQLGDVHVDEESLPSIEPKKEQVNVDVASKSSK